MVSLISGQEYFTFLYKHTKHNIHNREVAERKNKQTSTDLGWLQVQEGGNLWHFPSILCFCGLSQACIRAKFQHSHKEHWLIHSRWPTRSLGPQVLAVTFLWPSASLNFCWLLSPADCPVQSLNLAFPRFLPVSWEISRASPLCEFRAQNRQRNLTGTHPYPHRQKRTPNIVPQLLVEPFRIPCRVSKGEIGLCVAAAAKYICQPKRFLFLRHSLFYSCVGSMSSRRRLILWNSLCISSMVIPFAKKDGFWKMTAIHIQHVTDSDHHIWELWRLVGLFKLKTAVLVTIALSAEAVDYTNSFSAEA